MRRELWSVWVAGMMLAGVGPVFAADAPAGDHSQSETTATANPPMTGTKPAGTPSVKRKAKTKPAHSHATAKQAHPTKPHGHKSPKPVPAAQTDTTTGAGTPK